MRLRFQRDGNLPPGIHSVSWNTFKVFFGSTPHRRRLLAGLEKALINLKAGGCRLVYVDGSFVTEKERMLGLPPNDYDACWAIAGVEPSLLDPVFFDFSNSRAQQKRKFGGEFFPADLPEGVSGKTFLEFFQIDCETGGRKGIVAIDLKTLT